LDEVSLHIVQCYQGLVPPPPYGGIERLVFWLSRELVRRGHRVTLLADGRSKIAELVPGIRLVPVPEGCDDFRPLIPADAEIVHFHTAPSLGALPDAPYLVTEHGNRNHFRGYTRNTVFVSDRHARNHGATYFVYNGVPVDEYPLRREKRHQMLFLAKLNWRAKNAKTAIDLSLDAKIPLVLAGGNLWRSHKVWGGWIARSLYRRLQLRCPGEVDVLAKQALLQESRILFYLVNWEEPFGLACHEALSCGTPVLATPNGALPEAIRHGENGFIAGTYAEALECLESLESHSAAQTAEMADACRASAMTIERCAEGYEAYYQRVIECGDLYTEEERSRIRFRRPSSVRVVR
jgi:glycosyltransferase involved in cell wall biosynthesis